jgi:hypothetical protein
LLPSWSTPGELGSWFDETAWWDTPTLAREPRRALIELLEAVAGRFTGRELTLNVRDRSVRMRVDSVELRARESKNAMEDPLGWLVEQPGVRGLVRLSRSIIGRGGSEADAPPVEAVTLDASDLHVDGLLVGTVAVQVDGLRLDAKVPLPQLVTGPIRMDVQTTRARVVEWLRRQFPAYDIRLQPDDLVLVRIPGRRIRFLVRPAIDARSVRIETVGVVVLGRTVSLPRFLVRTSVRPLPRLGPSVEIVDVQVDGDDVTLQVRHEGVRQSVRLDALRTAVRDGVTKLGDAIFR